MEICSFEIKKPGSFRQQSRNWLEYVHCFYSIESLFYAEVLQIDCQKCQAACDDHKESRKDALWKSHEQY